MGRKKVLWGILAVLIVLAVIISLPPVWDRVSFHAQDVYSKVKYALFPPSEAVFNPGSSNPDFVTTSVAATLASAYATPTITVEPSPTPAVSSTPAPTPTPLPSYVFLEGVIPEPQLWNNCGPATLSMNLSYYNWGLDQTDVAQVIKPYDRDKNVMPYEMVDYVNDFTGLRALSRMGGTLDTLKKLVSAGFPVLVERGFEPANLKSTGWMGHFNLVIGYDDTRQVVITQDSYLLNHQEDNNTLPGFDLSYTELQDNWRAFNYVFIVVYPPEKENDVLNVLGLWAEETQAYRMAHEQAVSESNSLTNPRDLYFAWFNAGTSLVYLQDYMGAAAAYDTAFRIYENIQEFSRPWRMLWYQTGPYFAYYYAARYQDVIDLADLTLERMSSEPILEESYHWRGLAWMMLGDRKAAIEDFREALKYHEGFIPSYTQLQQLGELP